MLSVRVGSANKRKEDEDTTNNRNSKLNMINGPYTKNNQKGGKEKINENNSGIMNTVLMPPTSHRKTEFIKHMQMQEKKKKEKVLPTQFNFPSKFYSPHGDQKKQHHSMRKVPKQ